MKSLKLFEELIFFDCETTGLSHQTCHVIELACCKYTLRNGEYILTNQLDNLIKVDYPLPSEIIKITGITDMMLQERGVREGVVVKRLVKLFLTNTSKKKLMIAYNAPFDIKFVEDMLSRNRFSFPNNINFLDVLTIYKDRASYPHKLKNAISHYNLKEEFKNSHRALDDCIATYEVLKCISKDEDDLDKYVNLFGYNPKYPPTESIRGVRFLSQPYDSYSKLYQRQ
ncbi:MAG: 3'-5' exonuclease [Firmicutes bacterium]|nr:3'-5' exonuclease [Bacillota bacterium]